MHKIALQLGNFSVHWYGVLVAVGFLAGLWTASRRGLRDGINPESVMDIGPIILLGAMVGARTLYVISYWKERFADQPFPEIFMIQHGGLVFYGGLIGASLTFIGYTYWKNLPLWKYADVFAPSIALGHFFGRLGCLMNGCCYGVPTSLPWGIEYPVGHETHPVGQLATAVHPTQVYESALNLALYFSLAWLYRRKKFPGHVFATYLVCYAVIRSFVEMFRGDYPVHYLGGIATPAHLVSVGILAAGLLLFWKLPRFKPVGR